MQKLDLLFHMPSIVRRQLLCNMVWRLCCISKQRQSPRLRGSDGDSNLIWRDLTHIEEGYKPKQRTLDLSLKQQLCQEFGSRSVFQSLVSISSLEGIWVPNPIIISNKPLTIYETLTAAMSL